MSFAFGLSRSGMIPVVPLFSSFLTRRACDQLFIQIGYANANVKLIGGYCGLTSPNTGATHQSINEFAILRSMPTSAWWKQRTRTSLRRPSTPPWNTLGRCSSA